MSDVSEEESKASPFVWVIISGSPNPVQTPLSLVHALQAQARGRPAADSLQNADTPEKYPHQSPHNPLSSYCRIGPKSMSSSLTRTHTQVLSK